MAWIEPIYDRTESDLAYALEMLAAWLEDCSGVEDLKGALNVSDLNRIEGNIAYLSGLLHEFEYNPPTSSKEWTRSGIPNERDVQRILLNIHAILARYYVPSGTPEVPEGMKHYDEINAIEEILLRVKEVMDIMIASFKKSDTFQSNSKLFLPKRR